MTTIPQHIVMADDDNDVDIRFESFPGAVITQYYDKDKNAIGIAQKQEFLTLASYLLWVVTQCQNFTFGSSEYSDFAYFIATRPIEETLMLETQYVIRSYTFIK